jgi:hypothetical protein
VMIAPMMMIVVASARFDEGTFLLKMAATTRVENIAHLRNARKLKDEKASCLQGDVEVIDGDLAGQGECKIDCSNRDPWHKFSPLSQTTQFWNQPALSCNPSNSLSNDQQIDGYSRLQKDA